MKKLLFSLMSICCVVMMTVMPVCAREAAQEENLTELSLIMKTKEAVAAKQLPDEDAVVIVEFDKGAPVYVIGETTDGWYEIFYQGQEGYIQKFFLSEQDIDISGLDSEMEASALESRMVVEEVERYRAEARRSRIWGAVIILLIAGIFATGIISTVKGEKAKKENRNDAV